MENTHLIHNGEDNYYFRSSDVRIFPSAFRGTFKAGGSTDSPDVVFDPEARLNTEANFILPRAGVTDSYIIEFNDTQNKLKFVLGGYYFEISNIKSYIEETPFVCKNYAFSFFFKSLFTLSKKQAPTTPEKSPSWAFLNWVLEAGIGKAFTFAFFTVLS